MNHSTKISNRAKVLIFGKFDILHPGHIFLISKAKKHGKVTAILESDKTIEKFHNFTPFYNEKARKEKLKPYNVGVFLRKDENFEKILLKEKPDLLFFGRDQNYIREEFKKLSKKYNFKVKTAEDFHDNIFRSSRLRSILLDKKANIYFIDKTKEEQSFKAVAALRKILDMKKIGFSGTLDPLASGLMILASGKATRMLDWFHLLPKTYQAEIVFGQTSASYDLETEVVINKKAKNFDKSFLEKELEAFIGKQKQVAPVFSAKKINGKRLYKSARAGENILAPSKEIEIYDIKLEKFKYPKANIIVEVSAGTYIRSLVHDLGKKIGQGAVMSELRRVSIGNFKIEQSVSLKEINKQELVLKSIKPEKIIESLNQWFYQSQTW